MQKRFKVLVLVVLLALLGQFLLEAFLESRLRINILRLQQRKLPVVCSELDLPPVKGADNAASFYRAASDLMRDFDMPYTLDEWTAGKLESAQIPPEPLQQLGKAQALVKEGNARPGCRMLDHSEGWFMLTPDLSRLCKWTAVAAQDKPEQAVATLLPTLQMLVRLQPEFSQDPRSYTLLLSCQDWLLRPLERLGDKHVKADYHEILPLLAASRKLHESGLQQAANGLRVLNLDLFNRYHGGRPVPLEPPSLFYSLGGQSLVLLDELAFLKSMDVIDQDLAAKKSISNYYPPFYASISRQIRPVNWFEHIPPKNRDIMHRLEQLEVVLK